MLSSPLPNGVISASSRSSAALRPKAAVLLPPDMFELIYGNECLEAIRAEGGMLSCAPFMPDQALPHAQALAEAEVAFTGWSSPRFDAELLARMPRLRAVFHGAGSVRPYVTEAFWQRGIVISTAAAANAVPVAEYTLATILLALKQAWQLSRQARKARAFPSVLPAVPGARGATVGLVSLGLIGREVLRRLRAFELNIIAHDPYLPEPLFRELGVEPVSLPDLMRRSDVVSLHTPLRPETQGLIDGELLRLLKPGASFINTARGGVVNEPELIAFLRQRPDVQAILDVTDPEPPAPDNPLYDLPNVFLTPHIAGSLGPECRRLGAEMVREFGRYARGEPLHFALSRQQAEQQT